MSNSLMINAITESHFQFSGVSVDRLGASEYTLATVVIDMSGSVNGYSQELRDCLTATLEALNKSPRAENLLLRLVTFNEQVFEEHGFRPLREIKPEDYQQLRRPSGMTALFDASVNAIEATGEYGKTLADQEFDTNAIFIVITDGMDNRSRLGGSDVRTALGKLVASELVESTRSILVGVNTGADGLNDYLRAFRQQAEIDQYVPLADASAETLAKLADFISKSISVQSQSLGTGGPSQILSF